MRLVRDFVLFLLPLLFVNHIDAQKLVRADLMTLNGGDVSQPYLYRESPDGDRVIACQIGTSFSFLDYNSVLDVNTEQFQATNLYRLIVARIDPSNHVKWVKYIKGGIIDDIDFDDHDNLYISGNYQDVLATSSHDTLPLLTNSENSAGNVFVMSLAKDGHTRWMRTSDNGAYEQLESSATYIRATSQGRVYVAGLYDKYIQFSDSLTFYRSLESNWYGWIPFILGLDSMGNYLFAHDYDSETAIDCGLIIDSCRMYAPVDDGAFGDDTRVRTYDMGGRLLRTLHFPAFGANYYNGSVKLKNDRAIIAIQVNDSVGGRSIGFFDLQGNKIWDRYLHGVTIEHLDFTANNRIIFAGLHYSDSSVIEDRKIYAGTVFGEVDTMGNLLWLKNIRGVYMASKTFSYSPRGNIYFGVSIPSNTGTFTFDTVALSNLHYGGVYRMYANYSIDDSLYIAMGNCNTMAPAISCTDREGYAITPLISISGQTELKQDSATTIVASVIMGGNTPDYQWQDSTLAHGWTYIQGATHADISYVPSNTGDKIRCRLVTGMDCTGTDTVYSQSLIFHINKITAVLPTPGGGRISIYPNPAGATVYIDSLSLADNWQTASIYNVIGQRVTSVYSLVGRKEAQINVEGLNSGIYFLRLVNRKGFAVISRFLKQ